MCKVSLYSRNQISLNKKFFPITDSLQKLGFEAVLDGEIVVVDDQGQPNFQMLQNYQKSATTYGKRASCFSMLSKKRGLRGSSPNILKASTGWARETGIG